MGMFRKIPGAIRSNVHSEKAISVSVYISDHHWPASLRAQTETVHVTGTAAGTTFEGVDIIRVLP